MGEKKRGLWIPAFFLAAAAFLLTACPSSQPTASTPPADTTRPDDYYDTRNDEDEDRGRTLEDSHKRYTGSDCSEDDDCVEICRDIYNRKKIRDQCAELKVQQVEQLEKIYEVLKKPSRDDLEDIDAEDFKVFVELDLRPLDVRIGKLSSTNAKKVLGWIASADDGAVAAVFEDEDDDYRIFEKLLKKLDTDIKKALGRTVMDGKSFMELAVEDGGSVMDWVHNYFEGKCDSASSTEECVFDDWYCETDLSNEDFENLLDYKSFSSLMDEILDEYTTSGRPSWWKTDDDELSAEDLQGSQIRTLCGKTLREE